LGQTENLGASFACVNWVDAQNYRRCSF
jgi:hypothetical protein